MQLSRRLRNQIFWMVQIGGWSVFNLASLLVLRNAGTSFLVYSILSGILVGILSTTPLRYFLRNRISFDRFGWKESGYILGAILVGAMAYAGLNYLAGVIFERFADLENNELLKNILRVYNSVWLLVINSLIVITIWIICYLSIRLLLKLNANRLERLELSASLKQAQLNTLKGQINPHFMFNSLNNIRGLMLEDVNRSREMLTRLSEMLRYSLTQDDMNATTLEQELEMVGNYIDLSKIQLEDRLTFSQDIDPRSLSVEIPPMIVQLLVENAVKHGISNRKEGGYVVVKTHLDNDYLHIAVTNEGVLKMSRDTTQLGLNNIRQRLKLLYGQKSQFRLYQQGQQVVAEVKIPLE